jgi:hypothetical protein
MAPCRKTTSGFAHLDWDLEQENIWICTPRLGPRTRQHLGFAYLDWDLEQANTWIYTPGMGPGERQHLDLHTWNRTWHRATVLGAGGGVGGVGEREKKRRRRRRRRRGKRKNHLRHKKRSGSFALSCSIAHLCAPEMRSRFML